MHRLSPDPASMDEADRRDDFDFNDLLHPAQAFAHPKDVANDPDLTLSEKRAILASWASDACAVEAAPALRRPPGSQPVAFDEIMDALRALDQQARDQFKPVPHYRRVLAERVPGVFNRRSRDREAGGNRGSWN
jgi:hypothetical protein